jgi:hypothetical protein
MSNNGRFAEDANTSVEPGKETSLPLSAGNASADAAAGAARVRYPDMQSAVRFPIKLPVSVKSKSGANLAETENISANGVLFHVDSEMPVGSMVDFTISLPADVVGAEADVQLDCRGRVVRNLVEDGRRGVAVMIDEYRFERR